MVGKTTMQLGELNEGDYIMDFVGPLGIASHFDGMKKVAVIGGGVGCAIAYPQAKALFNAGAEVDVIAGFRSKDLIILEDEMRKVSDVYKRQALYCAASAISAAVMSACALRSAIVRATFKILS